MADSETIAASFKTWPTYAGYGPWTLLIPEIKAPGSEDYRIPEDQLPATQYAIKYNPLSDEMNINSWTVSQFQWTIAGFIIGMEAIATFRASYSRWLETNKRDCVFFSITALQDDPDGPIMCAFPPTFNYSIGDQFKECIHYGFSSTFLVWISGIGKVFFVIQPEFHGFLENVSRCRMKSFRLFSADITSVVQSDGKVEEGNKMYKLSTSLRNDIIDPINLTFDNLSMTIAKVDNKGLYNSAQSNIKVHKIEGKDVYIEAPVPEDPLKQIPDGWVGAYFEFSKTVIVRNPLTLFCDRELGSSSPNKYVGETALGYETFEQQISDTSEVRGMYVPKDQMISYLNLKIEDKTTDAEKLEEYKKSLEYVESEGIESIPQEGLIYASFESGSFGKLFLYYMKDMNSLTRVILNVGIGGAKWKRNNMHSACLAGEFFIHSDGGEIQTYRVVRHIRTNIYELDTRSRTSNNNLIDILLGTSDVTSFNFKVDSSRMWFFNDITFALGEKSSCDMALFWGSLTSRSESNMKSTVVLKVEFGYGDYSNAEELNDRFIKSVPSSNNFIQKWDDNNRKWYLNSENGGYYKINSISLEPSKDSFRINLDEIIPSEVGDSENDKWWISFDKKFEITAGYSYIGSPYFAAVATRGESDEDDNHRENLILNGLYTGLPLREKLSEGLAFTVVYDTGGILESPNSVTEVYISTGRKGNILSLSLNKFSNMKNISYIRSDDPMMSLIVRQGTINYMHNVSEYIVYYGDPIVLNATVAGDNGGDQYISMGQEANEYVILGLRCFSDVVPFSNNGLRPYIPLEIKQGGYTMGYKSTSGLVSNLYTQSDPAGKKIQESDFATDYKSGTVISKQGIDYIIASNPDHEKVINKNLLIISPKRNSDKYIKLKSAQVVLSPRENVVTNVTSPYVYAFNNHLDCVVYVKRQIWVLGSEGISDFRITGYDKIKSGRMNDGRTFDPVNQIDESQDGVFIMSTSNHMRYSSGLFNRTSVLNPGKKLSDYSKNLKASDLSCFPLLLVPNITRCSFDHNRDDLFVVGYSNIRTDQTSSNFGILSLAFYRVNLLDLDVYNIYGVKGNGGYVFTYSNYLPKYKRIVNAGLSYQEFPEDAPSFIDYNLSIGAVSIASNDKVIIIVAQQASGFVFFLSSDLGSTWSYIDDLLLVDGTASSPSIKIYDDMLWLMFTSGKSLFLKKIPMSIISNVLFYTKGKKSSEVEDTRYQNLKKTLQTSLSVTPVTLVSEIDDQQVSFENDNEQTLHIIGYGSDGIKGISSLNKGASWDYRPVNF